MKTELLRQVGLTKSEIRVYVALLGINSSPAANVAHETGMYRKNVYDALYSLMKKGLVSFAKTENGRSFTAADPQRLASMVETQKNEVQSLIQELKMKCAVPKTEDITIFKGTEGLKTIFEDVLALNVPYCSIGSGEQFRQLLPYYFSHYQKQKAEQAMRSKALCPGNERNSEFAKEFRGDIRFLPHDSAASTIICGTKIAIVLWNGNPTGIVVNNEHLAKSYSQYFEMLWRIAAK